MTQKFLILTNKITQISVIRRNYALFSPWKVKNDKMARNNDLNLLNSFTQGIFCKTLSTLVIRSNRLHFQYKSRDEKQKRLVKS